jgi:hypothetical protein
MRQVNLEPNHSHFLLVDNQKEAEKAWGGEIVFRFHLEKVYCQKKKVPRVLIVVQGGPKTLESVYEAVMSKCPVVLVADSGGVANMLHQFLAVARDPSSPHYREGAIPEDQRQKYSEGQVAMLKEIVARDFEQRLISSFALGESSQELDLHILNAIISDTTGYKPEVRLKLAVEWNRVDVVERVLATDFLRNQVTLSCGNQVTLSCAAVADAMRDALQCAIENQRVPIVRVLLKAAGQMSDSNFELKVDFISLYEAARRKVQNEIFSSSSSLREALQSERAMGEMGKPTSAATYKEVLSPFLCEYVPDMHERLEKLTEMRRRSDSAEDKAHSADVIVTQYNLSFSDLIIWATFVCDIELAEVFWGMLGRSNRGDPMRLALLCSQMSYRAADVAVLDRHKYVKNAETFEQWACELLRKCDEQDAIKMLLRQHDHWPHTVLRIAMRGHPKGSKKFIGETFVQRLVDRQWRGDTARGLSWQLPENTTSMSIVLHCFYRVIEMEPPQSAAHKRSERELHWRSGYMRLKPGLKRRLSRGVSDEELLPNEASMSERRASVRSQRRRSTSSQPPSPDVESRGGGFGFRGRAQMVLKNLVGSWQQKPSRGKDDDGAGPYERMEETAEAGGVPNHTGIRARTLSRTPSLRRFSSSTSNATSNGGGEEYEEESAMRKEEEAREAEKWRSFLEVPRVKFVLKLVSCTHCAPPHACQALAAQTPLPHAGHKPGCVCACGRGAWVAPQTRSSSSCTFSSCCSTAASPTQPSRLWTWSSSRGAWRSPSRTPPHGTPPSPSPAHHAMLPTMAGGAWRSSWRRCTNGSSICGATKRTASSGCRYAAARRSS